MSETLYHISYLNAVIAICFFVDPTFVDPRADAETLNFYPTFSLSIYVIIALAIILKEFTQFSFLF